MFANRQREFRFYNVINIVLYAKALKRGGSIKEKRTR